MFHHDELPSIDPSALNDITGGVTSTKSSTNAQRTAALQGITSQIASLGQNNNNNSSSSSLQPILPLLLLTKSGAGGACPCGCGMANCIRR